MIEALDIEKVRTAAARVYEEVYGPFCEERGHRPVDLNHFRSIFMLGWTEGEDQSQKAEGT